MDKQTAILVNIPHASTVIPEAEASSFNAKYLQREIGLMTDHFTDDLFSSDNTTIRFPVSRLVCDVERFRADEDEIMSAKGMGAIYTACSDYNRLRTVSDEHKEYLLKTYYDPYHQEFEEQTERKLQTFGKCLIIDGHSFPAKPLPYENGQNPCRPDICIGMDDYHTPSRITELLYSHFEGKGYTVAVNAPFAGAIVPSRFYRTNLDVQSVMIEINRGLYIDNEIRKTKRYGQVKRDIGEAIRALESHIQIK